MATVVLGSQWGDEGKGKLVDILCDEVEICARCQGGNNAGHTIVVDGVMYDFHILPSGLINPKCINLIGSGVVVNVPAFFSELKQLEDKGLSHEGRIFISDRAHLVFDIHQIADGYRENELGRGSLGTTKRGIGPAYSTKMSRSGIRVGELFNWEKFEERFRDLVAGFQKRYELKDYDIEAELARYKEYSVTLKDYVVDAVSFMSEAQKANKKILVEGANALMLDIDYGTYPFVTSSNTGIGGVITGLAISPFKLKKVIGVVKAYTTRVGAGPFVTEQLNEVGERLQQVGREWGVTTGRKRRCGWLDLVVLKYSTDVNCYTSLNITKLDILDGFEEIKVCVGYKYDGEILNYFPADLGMLEKVEPVYKTFQGWDKSTGLTEYVDLPEKAKEYIKFIEDFVGVPVEYIGVGPSRDHMLIKHN